MPVARLAVQVHDGNDTERATIDPVNHGIREPPQTGLACLVVELRPHLEAGLDLGDGDLGGGSEPLAQFFINAAIIKRCFFQLEDCGVVPKDVMQIWRRSVQLVSGGLRP